MNHVHKIDTREESRPRFAACFISDTLQLVQIPDLLICGRNLALWRQKCDKSLAESWTFLRTVSGRCQNCCSGVV